MNKEGVFSHSLCLLNFLSYLFSSIKCFKGNGVQSTFNSVLCVLSSLCLLLKLWLVNITLKYSIYPKEQLSFSLLQGTWEVGHSYPMTVRQNVIKSLIF